MVTLLILVAVLGALLAGVAFLVIHRKEAPQTTSEDESEEEVPAQVMPPLVVTDPYFLERLDQCIRDEMSRGEVKVETLADKMCLSRSQLNRRVQALVGMSTSNYTTQLRLEEACRLLQHDTILPVSEIALRCGFEDAAYFTRAFKRYSGLPPTAYRKAAMTRGNPPNPEPDSPENSRGTAFMQNPKKVTMQN